MTGTATEMLDVNHLLRPETATGSGMTETRMDGQETVPPSVTPSPLVPGTRNKRVRPHYWSCARRAHADRPLGTPEPSGSRPRQDSEAPADGVEEGEAMDATNDDDAAMMAMMGLTGFGTTKVSHIAAALCLYPQRLKRETFQGKHVEGNQEGAVNVKKQRTWRQYMNRCAFSVVFRLRRSSC